MKAVTSHELRLRVMSQPMAAVQMDRQWLLDQTLRAAMSRESLSPAVVKLHMDAVLMVSLLHKAQTMLAVLVFLRKEVCHCFTPAANKYFPTFLPSLHANEFGY